MPLWDKTGTKPQYLSREAKRNVVATDIGFVRRITYTDVHGNSRQKDEVLVPIRDLAGPANFGFPDITDVWHEPAAAPVGTQIATYVSFDEPIRANTDLQLAIANTAGGSAEVAVANTTVAFANNTLKFVWTPSVAGTYKVEAQSITAASNAASGQLVISLNAGGESANLVITGAVSNTSGTVVIS